MMLFSDQCFAGKRLLVLGGVTLAQEIVWAAQKRGATVFVTDYLVDSPAKKVADGHFMVSVADVDEVVKLIKQERIDGVLTGFVDSILPYYVEICHKANLPCYCTHEQIAIATDKKKFKALCRKFNVPVVDEFVLTSELSEDEVMNLPYPVCIKPVDNSGGRGIYFADNPTEFVTNYHSALAHSPTQTVLVERKMNHQEATIFYIIQDGQIHCSGMADRHVQNGDENTIPLPVAYTFPSVYLDSYLKNIHPQVVKMLTSIEMNQGFLFIQTFIENGQCIFYEMGFRTTGVLEYKCIEFESGLNHLDCLIHFALTSKMANDSIASYIQPYYQHRLFNLTFQAYPQTIGHYVGLESIKQLAGVLDVFVSYHPPEVMPVTSKGTLRCVVVRVFGWARDDYRMVELINKIHDLFDVIDIQGQSMLQPVWQVDAWWESVKEQNQNE